jgi:hemoglobin
VASARQNKQTQFEAWLRPLRRATVTLVARSIYEAAGCGPAFQALAAAHHARCLADPVLNHPFSHGGHPEHVQRLGQYWAEVCGGPAAFSERAGNQSDVLEMHARQQADDDLGERFLACFVAAFDDAGLPEDRELRTALTAYMRWAVDDVMTYSPADAVVPTGKLVPRWSWDGLVT